MRRASAIAAWAAIACSTQAPRVVPTGPPEPRQLTEDQALAAIQEALVRAGVPARRSLPVILPGGAEPVPLEVDVHFGVPPFGIEWVTAQERERYGAVLPASSPTSPLRIVAANGAAGSVQVLVLDEGAYRYEANALLVQRGAPGIEDAEQRVRRDVTEFVEYVRDQGAALRELPSP